MADNAEAFNPYRRDSGTKMVSHITYAAWNKVVSPKNTPCNSYNFAFVFGLN
jgi:hypothetical protein